MTELEGKTKMARMDHTNCTHPRTPAGRAACRKSGAVAPDRIAAYAKKHHTDPASIVAAMNDMKRELTAAEITAANEAMSALIGTDPIDHRVDDADNQALVQVVVKRNRKMTRAELASPIIQSMMRKP